MSQNPPPLPPLQLDYYANPMLAASKPTGLATASMVLGIISLGLFCAWYLALPCAVLAVVFGAVARSQATRGVGGGRSMATAGIVCGIIAIAIAVLAIVGFLAFFVHGMRNAANTTQPLQPQPLKAHPPSPQPWPRGLPQPRPIPTPIHLFHLHASALLNLARTIRF